MANSNANFAARVAEVAARHPARQAIVEYVDGRPRRLTFGGLAERAAALAAGLRGRGVERGHTVLLLLPSGETDFHVALLACLHLGAAVMLVEPRIGRARLSAALAAVAPRVVIGALGLRRLTHGPVRRIPVHVHVSRGSLKRTERPAAAESAADVEPHRPAIITVSTGETGTIKTAACSHAALRARARCAQGALAAERVDMPVLPSLVLDNLACGTTSVLPDLDPRYPRVVAAATIVHQMEVELVATSSGPPDFYERLSRWCAAKGRKLPLRALCTGGVPVSPMFARRLADTTRGDVIVVYGTREAMPIARIETRAMFAAMARDSHGQPPDGLCMGTPVTGLSLLLIHVTDEPIRLGPDGWTPWPVEPGAVGEVVVAGDHVVTEPVNGAEADPTSSVHAGGRVWHRTGDAGRLDPEGRLWLMGRIRRRVQREGRVWWSIPAETRTFKVGGITHAAYFGVPDPRLGQRAVLCVEVPGRKLSTVERERLRAALAPMPVDELHVIRRIPRDARHASATDMRSLLDWVAERGPALSA